MAGRETPNPDAIKKRTEERTAQMRKAMQAGATAPAFAPGQEKKPERRPLQVDPFAHTADGFLDTRPPDPEMLFDGCPRGCVAAIVGAPGSGKSTLSAQMLATLAAQQTFFGKWEAHTPARSLLLSVEDPANVIRQRVHDALHGLPVEMQRGAASLISVPPVYGHVSLFELHGNSLSAGSNFDDFRALVRAYKPQIVILDTLSRFGGGVEGDNAAMSEACSYLEEVACENGTNVFVVHHNSKGAGGLLAKDDDTLYSALDAYAARGASALTGAVRWQLNIAPLTAEYAVKKIGDAARGLSDGMYVAARVCKKNYGPPESRIFLRHNPRNGLFERVEPLAEEKRAQSLADDVDALLSEIRSRAAAGLPPLSVTMAGKAMSPPWGVPRTAAAVKFCIDSGRAVKLPNPNGKKGEVLAIPPGPGISDAEDGDADAW